MSVSTAGKCAKTRGLPSRKTHQRSQRGSWVSAGQHESCRCTLNATTCKWCEWNYRIEQFTLYIKDTLHFGNVKSITSGVFLYLHQQSLKLCFLMCCKQTGILCGVNRIIQSSKAHCTAPSTALDLMNHCLHKHRAGILWIFYGKKKCGLSHFLLAIIQSQSQACHSSDNNMLYIWKLIH